VDEVNSYFSLHADIADVFICNFDRDGEGNEVALLEMVCMVFSEGWNN